MKHNCTFLIKVAKTLARVQREIADVLPFAGCWINSLDLPLAHVLDAEDVE